MRASRDTEPILPTTNMSVNGKKDGSGKKKVLVVGAGAAGILSTTSKCEDLRY
jgi:threonine dehydrogenase-like Zn-dependent dehydrogenase